MTTKLEPIRVVQEWLQNKRLAQQAGGESGEALRMPLSVEVLLGQRDSEYIWCARCAAFYSSVLKSAQLNRTPIPEFQVFTDCISPDGWTARYFTNGDPPLFFQRVLHSSLFLKHQDSGDVLACQAIQTQFRQPFLFLPTQQICMQRWSFLLPGAQLIFTKLVRGASNQEACAHIPRFQCKLLFHDREPNLEQSAACLWSRMVDLLGYGPTPTLTLVRRKRLQPEKKPSSIMSRKKIKRLFEQND